MMSKIECKIGPSEAGNVPANGNWHDLTSSLSHCYAFEIIAYVGKEKHGRYALAHAHALSTFGASRGRIRITQATYNWQWWNRISFRWVGSTYDYKLQIRTRSNYGPDCHINYHTTQIWNQNIQKFIQNKESEN